MNRSPETNVPAGAGTIVANLVSSYSAAAEAAAEQRPYFFFEAFFLAFFFAFAMLALQLSG
jgi:hypothetical protein